jgi:fibro-slime domain-containing protein
VPVPAANFPEKCKITEHLASWFLPESLAVDAQGNTLTNMTCRDLYISLDEEGFWLAEISKDAISKGNESNRGGMFLLDDFEYLDAAKTVPNPYYDQLRGGSDNRNHNFGFTMKIQATFEYIPGQYFDFLGDDDVWVFINNKLVVDIGGQHAQVAGAVNLDTLGLTVGEIYPFHIFYAERHTSSSNFRMHTSIDLKSSDDLQTECH